MNTNKWIPIKNFEQYEINQQGQIRSKKPQQKIDYETAWKIKNEFEKLKNTLKNTQIYKQLGQKYSLTPSAIFFILSRVNTIKQYKIIKPFKSKDGYFKVGLRCSDKTQKKFFIHRLLYEAFIGPIPEGFVIDHIDENKQNNSLDNLQALSQRDNAIKHLKTINKLQSYPQNTYIAKNHGLTSVIEEWRPVIIPAFSHYYVSNRGQVERRATYSHKHNIDPDPLTPQHDKNGYPRVLLRAGKGKCKFTPVHTLVLEAFFGPRPDKHYVNHINGNKIDNRIENLEFVSSSENRIHALKNGLVPKGKLLKLNPEDIPIIRKLYNIEKRTVKFIADQFYVSTATISNIINKKTWNHID